MENFLQKPDTQTHRCRFMQAYSMYLKMYELYPYIALKMFSHSHTHPHTHPHTHTRLLLSVDSSFRWK